MPNLDRFSQGAEDAQDIPRWGVCDDCLSDIYPNDEVCKVDSRIICLTCLDSRTEDVDGIATARANSIGGYIEFAYEI